MGKSLEPSPQPRRMPKMLLFVQPCTLIDDFVQSEQFDQQASYDGERQISILPDGLPLYCARYPTPPTTTITPGHTIPAGYTSTGKYKPAKYVPSKSDKRAGR